MPARRPLTILIDAAGRAMRALARILGRIGAARRHRAVADQTLAALAEKFPGAPEHWLRFIAEQAPALAEAGEAGLRTAATPEPRRAQSPVPEPAVPDRPRPPGRNPVTEAASPLPATPAIRSPAEPRRRPALVRLEPTRAGQAETPARAAPAQPKARGTIRMVRPVPAAPAPRPDAVATPDRPVPATTRPTAAAPLPRAAVTPDEAPTAGGKPRLQPNIFSGVRRIARLIARRLRPSPAALRPSRSDTLPDDGAAWSGDRRMPGQESVAPLPIRKGRLQPAGQSSIPSIADIDIAAAGPSARIARGQAGPQADRSAPGRRDLAVASAAPPAPAPTGVGASWAILTHAGRVVEGRDPDWPALPLTGLAPIVDAHVDPSRLDRLRQEQEVGLWSA